MRGRFGRTAALITAVALLAACEDIKELFPELPTSEAAIVTAFCGWVHGILAPRDTLDCATRLSGDGSRAASTRGNAAESRAGVSSNGTSVAEILQVTSVTKAGKLPKWRADLPQSEKNTNQQIVVASVAFADPQFGNPSQTPKKLKVTLYEVDSKGKRSKVSKGKSNIKNAAGSVVFEGLKRPKDHYQVEYKLGGGKLGASLLIFNSAIGDAGNARQAIAAPGRFAATARALANNVEARDVESALALRVDSYTIDGNVGAGALPEFTADLLPTNTSPTGGDRSVAAFIVTLNKNYQPAGKSASTLTATLYDVDGKGKRSKLASKSVKLDQGAGVLEFTGLSKPSDHFQVVLEPSGGGGTSGYLMMMVADGTTGLARTLARPASLRVPPPVAGSTLR